MDEFNVVFEYTQDAGGYEGVITWSSFPSEEEFEKCKGNFANQRVITEGVSAEEAIEHVNSTPLEAYIGSAIEEASQGDKLNRYILEMQLGNGIAAYVAKDNERMIPMAISASRTVTEILLSLPKADAVTTDPAYRKLVQKYLADEIKTAMGENSGIESLVSLHKVATYHL